MLIARTHSVKFSEGIRFNLENVFRVEKLSGVSFIRKIQNFFILLRPRFEICFENDDLLTDDSKFLFTRIELLRRRVSLGLNFENIRYKLGLVSSWKCFAANSPPANDATCLLLCMHLSINIFYGMFSLFVTRTAGEIIVLFFVRRSRRHCHSCQHKRLLLMRNSGSLLLSQGCVLKKTEGMLRLFDILN